MAVHPGIVVDANVFISAFLFGGKPGLVLDLIDEGVVELIYSATLRAETEKVLADKFGWTREQIEDACDDYWSDGELVKPATPVRACIDPRDDYLLECALEGGAEFLVTGDRDLLRIGVFRGCAIVTPADFLARISRREP